MANCSKVFVDDVEEFAEEVANVLARDAGIVLLVVMARLHGLGGQRAIRALLREAGRGRVRAELLVRLAVARLGRAQGPDERHGPAVVPRRDELARDEQLLAQRETWRRQRGRTAARAPRARRLRGAQRRESLLQAVVVLLEGAHLRLEVDALLLLVHPVRLHLVEPLLGLAELVHQLAHGGRGRLLRAARCFALAV